MRFWYTENHEGDTYERKPRHRDEHWGEARLLQDKSANPLTNCRRKACGHPEACLFGSASMLFCTVIYKCNPHGSDDAEVEPVHRLHR